jgi:hypothetical protein
MNINANAKEVVGCQNQSSSRHVSAGANGANPKPQADKGRPILVKSKRRTHDRYLPPNHHALLNANKGILGSAVGTRMVAHMGNVICNLLVVVIFHIVSGQAVVEMEVPSAESVDKLGRGNDGSRCFA